VKKSNFVLGYILGVTQSVSLQIERRIAVTRS